QVSDAVVTVGSDMAIKYWNKGAEHLTGFKAEEAVGRGPEELLQFRFEKPEAEHEAWGVLAEEGSWTGEIIISTPHTDGERYIHASANVLFGPDGDFNGLLAVMRDDTERREMQDRLIHHAYHDTLTGLPNRMMFLRSLDSATASSRNDEPDYAILFLDLDRFKMVNDSLGHHAGDALLKMFAFRLKQCIREGDVIARLGGDEFAVLLNGVGGERGATYVANRILESLVAPFIIEGMEVFSSASIGIVLGDPHYDLAEDLLRDADAAMYQAKRKGRSCYAIFDEAQQMQASALLQLESDLRRAIERDELRVFYQPIIDLRSGSLYGFEALVRWYHPHRGLIAPAQFVSVAEETGLIVDLDRWVFQNAAEQLAVWDQRFGDLNLSISVNCSNRSFHDPELVDYIASVLDLTGLGESRIALEITERVLIDDGQRAAQDIERIKQLGLKVSLDDFGTGYASLSMLHSLPIDILKIDRTFIKRMERQDGGLKMVKTVVDLARSLGMRAVAEGVETLPQLDHLKQMDCEFGQGYLFSKPLDSDMTGALIARRTEWLGEIFQKEPAPVRSVA
ncbi:MAG: EAL domain-containing protein, partial [Rhodothermales bacterium]|nr:EAL domain-containing protein [Rhodothermales bacterium]